MMRTAVAMHRQGDLAGASALYETVLRHEPDSFDALHLLGVLRTQQGKVRDAVDLIGRALRLFPGSPDAHQNLGDAFRHLGDPKAAADSYQRALEIRPNFTEAHNRLGTAYLQMRRPADAIASYRRALELRPDFPEAHNNLGNALNVQQSLGEAVDSFRRALEIRPDFAEAHSNLGTALKRLGRLDEAISSYRHALKLRPNYPEAHNNLGNVLMELGCLADAVASFDRALGYRPDYAEAHCNRGYALSRAWRNEEAIVAFQQALILRPSYAEAHYRLANALAALGRHAEAAASYRQALAHRPDYPLAPGALAESLRRICDWTGMGEIVDAIRQGVRAGRPVARPFSLLALTDDPEEIHQCARTYTRARAQSVSGSAVCSLPAGQADGRIRLAYLSTDFRNHAAAHLMAQLFERHDRRRFEVFAISLGPDDGSAMRARLRRGFDHFIDVHRMSDPEISQRIAALGIHIAVDLNGHTQGARLGVLARRSAPVQVNYLGIPGTMGADFIDYILVDRFIVPADQQPHFSECLVHLPNCYMVTDDTREIATETPSREECGLPNDGFVFCCFNNCYKITPPIFAIWMRLLHAVPGSVVWLLGDNEVAIRNLRREAEARHIRPERLVFAPRWPPSQHLARHRQADLFLDTLPYTAHTTASDALWAGLPVVTCTGRTFASRVAGSLLHAVELPDLVTDTLEDYEATALRLATQPAELEQVRCRLRDARSTAPLFDTDRFRRNVEAAYVEMWRIHEAGGPVRPFTITR